MSSIRPRQFTTGSANSNALSSIAETPIRSLPAFSDDGGRFLNSWQWLKAARLLGAVFTCVVALGWPCTPQGTAVASEHVTSIDPEVVLSGAHSVTADEFEDFLDDIIDALNDGLQIATAHALPLSSQEKQSLDARLDNAEALIDQVFNPTIEPNLTPVDTGSVSLLFTPSTLADYAEQCIELAQDAKAELLQHGDAFDHALVGTKLKTIRYLTSRSSPHNYRTKAGIN